MRILIALDRSEYADIVLAHGLDQATRQPSSELHVVTAVRDASDADAARATLDTAVREALDAFGLTARPVMSHVVVGQPAAAICTLAKEIDADLLVIGRFFVPSLTERFEQLAPCATMVVGLDGVEVEPQCLACEAVRSHTQGEQLFCERHANDRVPDLVTRMPVISAFIQRRWML